MALPKITVQQQRKIESLIQGWSKQLTWDALVEVVKLEVGIQVTRQTLCTYSGIAASYKNKKNLLRGATPVIQAKLTQSDVSLFNKVEQLKAEISVLERKNTEQLRFIERMLSNAKEIPNIDLRQLIKPRSEEINSG
jgi:hypothetical protein